MDNKIKGSGNDFFKKIWFWVLVVVAIVGVGGTATYANEKEHKLATEVLSQAKQQSQNNLVENNDVNGESQSISIASSGDVLNESSNNDNSTAKEATLKAGTYEVGKDVQPGYYTATLTGTGKINIYDSAENEILEGSIQEGETNKTATIKFQLNSGEKLELEGFSDVKLTPYVHKYLSTLNEGSYIVGESVKPGKYTVDIPAGTGSVSVLNEFGIPVYNEMTIEGQNNNQSQSVTLDLKVGNTINITGIDGVKLTAA